MLLKWESVQNRIDQSPCVHKAQNYSNTINWEVAFLCMPTYGISLSILRTPCPDEDDNSRKNNIQKHKNHNKAT